MDPGFRADRVPQQPYGPDGLPHYPTNGNGHVYPELPQIPHIPQIPQIPHIPINGHGNGNGQRPQGPVGELKFAKQKCELSTKMYCMLYIFCVGFTGTYTNRLYVYFPVSLNQTTNKCLLMLNLCLNGRCIPVGFGHRCECNIGYQVDGQMECSGN